MPTTLLSNALQKIERIHQKEQRLEQERLKSIEKNRKDSSLNLQSYESEHIADKIIENDYLYENKELVILLNKLADIEIKLKTGKSYEAELEVIIRNL